jgi:methyl-accepting chemotaxis protein
LALREGYRIVQDAASHARRLSEMAEKPGRGQSTQSQRMSGMVENIEKISASVNEIAASVSQAEQVAGNVEANGLQGMGVIGEAVKVSETIENSIEGVTQSIAALGDRADEINSMVGSVRAIAEQTNLLALNAAIEAARAGEQGRGFAVVADEVRKLAERTASTTRDIATTVESIQKGIYSAVFEMRRANEDAGSGNKFAHQAEDAFRQINESVQQLVSMIRSIAEASRDQSVSIEGMASSVVNLASNDTESDSGRKFEQELESCRNKLSEYTLQYKV